MNLPFLPRPALNNFRSIISLIVFLLGFTGVAFGDIQTWTFDGIITSGLAGSPYQANRPYAATFSIDASSTSPTNTGLYFPIDGYSFHVTNGVSVSGFSASSTGSGVLVANDQPAAGGGSFDGIIFSMFGEQSTGFPAGVAFDGSAFGITLVNNSTGPTAAPFSDTSFPSTLNLNNFSGRFMSVYFQSGAVTGSVNSIYINGVLVSQVPEPGGLNLFASGGLLLCGYLAARRKYGRN